jgi:hypothetical protein
MVFEVLQAKMVLQVPQVNVAQPVQKVPVQKLLIFL